MNFCNNELKQRILLGGLLESGILLQPNSSKAKLTVINKNRSNENEIDNCLKKLFLNFSADFIEQ